MKSKIILGLLVVAAVSFAVTSGSAKDAPWFDMKNCEICKGMVAEEGLMENMTWESHVISTGMMAVTTVAADYHEAYKRAKTHMHEAIEKAVSGEKVNMCAACTSFGELHMAGVKFEHFDTESGEIMVATSTDPKLIEKIQAHAKRSIDEFAKMHADEGDGHDGHNH